MSQPNKQPQEPSPPSIRLVFAMPQVDVQEGKNGIETVYLAEYDKGVEVTVEFADEDRPGWCGLCDCLYDCLRRPLFGRRKDIETFFVLLPKQQQEQQQQQQDTQNQPERVHFPGTASGPSQTYQTTNPQHVTETVPLSAFERYTSNNNNTAETDDDTDDDERPIVIYVNTWNHLFGHRNNNPSMKLLYLSSPNDYTLRMGMGRSQVDQQYKGCITSVQNPMPPDIQSQLGARTQ